jgi:hypothetical protein
MKKIFFVLCLTIISISVYAQPTKDEISYVQSLWGMQKRDIVKEHMNLSGSDSAAFWNEYEKYEASRKELGNERIKTIVEYTDNYNKLTDTKADELTTKMLSNNSKFIELLSTTYSQMKAVISPLKASQFIQIELYLDSALKVEISDEIPFIGEMDKEKKK